MTYYPHKDCCRKRGRKHPVNYTFLRKELLYDIANYAFIEGDLLPDDTEHARHLVRDIIQDGNIDRVNRVLDIAHAECVEMLYPYTKHEIEEGWGGMEDNTPECNAMYVISPLYPEGFSMSSAMFVKHLLHEYMVCRVLQDWLSIVLPQSAEKWLVKLTGIRDRIKSALMSRCKVMHRAYHPF